MSRRPRVTGTDLLAALGKASLPSYERREATIFSVIKTNGELWSRFTRETIGPGLLHKILRDCQMNVEDLQKLLG